VYTPRTTGSPSLIELHTATIMPSPLAVSGKSGWTSKSGVPSAGDDRDILAQVVVDQMRHVVKAHILGANAAGRIHQQQVLSLTLPVRPG
jgi:hypothetical protein